MLEDTGGPGFLDYFSVGDMLARRAAGDVSWVNPLIFQIMLVISAGIFAAGVVVEARRKKT